MATAPFYLHASDAEAKQAVTLGQGFPPTHNGMPCSYFWRPVIADGEYTHPSKGFKLAVDATRRKGWEANFRRMLAVGEKVPVVKDHADDKSDATLGYVMDYRQNGAWLEELHQYIGDDARDVALRNQISVGIDPAYVTGRGVAIGDCIVHSATTPRPVVPGQGDAVPYAASRGPAGDVLMLSLAAPTKESDMDLTALRKAVGAADTVPDADVIQQATAKLGEIPGIVQARTTAETELGTAKQELSRAKPGEPIPPAIATGSVRNLHKQVELMAREGSISGAQAEAAKKLIGTPEQPNVMALSRTGIDHPAEGWLEVLALSKSGVKADGQSQTGVQELSHQSHDRSGVTDPNAAKKANDAQVIVDAQKAGEAYQAAQLKSRGLA